MTAARTILIGLTCVVVSLVVDALFLPHQSLWVDEVTQLSGMNLGPVETTRWLARWVTYDFQSPDDRMPPLSYYCGWVWTRIFGFGEQPMRWFGITCVATSTAILFAAANRAWGLASGVAAALLLATSPNVVAYSIEIRSYPLLILMSSGLFACLVGYANGPIESRRRWLAGMVAFGIGAMYSHFFGLVALGGGLVAAFAIAIARRDKVVPVIVAAMVAGVASLGLIPFIRAAVGMTPGASVPWSLSGKATGLASLVIRLFSHPATLVSLVAVVLAALGFALGIACVLARGRRASPATWGLALALAAGGAVVTLAHLVQSSLAVTLPTYNFWMVPLLALLFASGLAADGRVVRLASRAAVGLMIAANAYSIGELTVHGDYFAHTAYGPVATLMRAYDPARVAVIHDDDELTRALTFYNPIHYEFGVKVGQFIRVDPHGSGAGGEVEVTDLPDQKTKVDATNLPYENLVVISSATLNAKDLARLIHGDATPTEDGPVTKALLASDRWERVENRFYPAFASADVDVFRKVARP